MIRITADTKIYISALQFGGPPLHLINQARAGSFLVAISPPLLVEIRRVLDLKFAWETARLEDALTLIRGFTISVDPQRAIDAVPSDPDDNRVLECAVESKSDYIVTGDNDLLRLGGYDAIRIVKAAEFMTLFSAG